MAVGMPAVEVAAPLGQRIEKLVVKVLDAERAVALPRPALVSEKKILRHRIRLVPGIGLVFSRPPVLALLSSLSRQMRQRRVGGLLEYAISVRISRQLM